MDSNFNTAVRPLLLLNGEISRATISRHFLSVQKSHGAFLFVLLIAVAKLEYTVRPRLLGLSNIATSPFSVERNTIVAGIQNIRS